MEQNYEQDGDRPKALYVRSELPIAGGSTGFVTRFEEAALVEWRRLGGFGCSISK
jgi:hypothetical protein